MWRRFLDDTPSEGETECDPFSLNQWQRHALKALISGLMGSDVSQPNKSFKGRIVDFQFHNKSIVSMIRSIRKYELLVKDIRQGKMDEYLDAIIRIQKKNQPNSSVLPGC